MTSEPSRPRDADPTNGPLRPYPQHDEQVNGNISPLLGRNRPMGNRPTGNRPTGEGDAEELLYDDMQMTREDDNDEDGLVEETEEEKRAYMDRQHHDYDEEEFQYGHGRSYGHQRYGRRYRDLDHDGGKYGRRYSRSPRRRSRSRSPKGQGRPMDTIIIEGIPEGLTVNDLRTSFYSTTDLVDFPTAQIRLPPGPRAFITFQALSDAIKWMESNFPRVELEFPGRQDIPDERISCRIHYARTSYDPQRNEPTSYPPVADQSWRLQLNGATDASQTPSQILVFYPLQPDINEEKFALGVKQLEKDDKSDRPRPEGAPKLKSTAPVGDTTGLGAKKGSLHRVFLIREIADNQSLNYGFAEFWTFEDSMAAMAKFSRSRKFEIGDSPVMVSTIHLGVFVPETREVTPHIEKHSFYPLLNPNIRVRYRDLHVYPSVKIVTVEPPQGTVLPVQHDASEEAKKAKKRKGDALASGPAKKPIVMAGQMAMWQKKHAEIVEPGQDGNTVKSSANSIPVASRGSIKISLGSFGKSFGSNSATETPPSVTGSSSSVASSEESYSPTSFIDREKFQCLLCMMKYKSLDDCNIHERSRNHRTALKDPSKVTAAIPRVQKRAQKHALANTDSRYRDRAAERRTAFNQPSKPLPVPKEPKIKSKVEVPVLPKPENTVATGKGSSLLAKMGWMKGSGLGANGEGRTEIIETKAYQEGVGLGAEGGELGDAEEVARGKLMGRKGYVETVQDKARERYKKLGE